VYTVQASILVLEDDQETAAACARAWPQAGTGRLEPDGLDMVLGDVLIVGRMLPFMDGLVVIQRLREDKGEGGGAGVGPERSG
jgi:DNA-binding response OmpR family regulator